jgi:hypothetical protein
MNQVRPVVTTSYQSRASEKRMKKDAQKYKLVNQMRLVSGYNYLIAQDWVSIFSPRNWNRVKGGS